MSTSRVFKPCSDCDPKLIFLAITSGRSSRSARLFSAGMLWMTRPVVKPGRVLAKNVLDFLDAGMLCGRLHALEDLRLDGTRLHGEIL